jgi:hypothetical protein
MGRTRDVSKILTSNTSILSLASASTTYATKASTGVVLLNTTSFTTQTTVSVDNVFSSTYDNYLIRVNNLANSENAWTGIRMRVSGSDYSGATYRKQVLSASSTTLTGSRTLNDTSWNEVFYQNTSIPNFNSIEIQNPFLTEVTSAVSIGSLETAASTVGIMFWYGLNTTTSYDGFTLIPAGGNITGSVSVYGYNK